MILKNNIVLFIGPKIKLDLKKLCNNHFHIKIMGKLSSRKVSNLFSKISYGIFIT